MNTPGSLFLGVFLRYLRSGEWKARRWDPLALIGNIVSAFRGQRNDLCDFGIGRGNCAECLYLWRLAGRFSG